MRRDRSFQVALMLLAQALLVAAFPAWIAFRSAPVAEWNNRFSQPFALRAGHAGVWVESWVDQGSKDEQRVVILDPVVTEGTAPIADIFLRVEPAGALIERAGVEIDAEGWVELPTTFDRESQPVLAPTKVRRIEYRVEHVEPAFEGKMVRLFVPGRARADSTEPAWMWWSVAFLVVALGSVPLILSLRQARPASGLPSLPREPAR